MADWKNVRVGDVCEQIRGVSYKPADLHNNLDDNSVALLRANNIFENALTYNDLVYVDNKKVSDSQYLKKGDILICASSGSKNLVGKAACLEEDRKLTFGAFCKVLRTNSINHGFFKHYFFSQNYRITISNLSAGANINNIRAEDLDNLQIPFPPIETQKQIAATLDKVTKIIAESKQLLTKYDLLIKSRFIEMFGDNPIENWNVEKLRNTGNFKNGMNFSYEDNGFEINCLGVGDFKDNSVISETSVLPIIFLNEKPTDEYLLQKEDIVFVRSNGNKDLVGRCVLVYPDTLSTFSGFCIRYRKTSEKLNSIYLLQYLKMPNTRKRMSGRGANIQNLNQQILSNLEIPIPPLALQQQFAAFVQQIDKSKFTVQKSLEKAETLYKSLMQEYFA